MRGIVDLAKMWDEGFKKHTPREYAYGHSKRAGARSSKATRHLDGTGLSACANQYDPGWEQAAGYDEVQAHMETIGLTIDATTDQGKARGASIS